MARFREYTPARRHVMQALMWLIFAATYAGAVALGHARAEALRITLTPTIADGDLLYRLPAGWESKRHKSNDVLQISATEPRGADRVRRVLKINLFLHQAGPIRATEVMAKI